jgi:hypothetical protein
MLKFFLKETLHIVNVFEIKEKRKQINQDNLTFNYIIQKVMN